MARTEEHQRRIDQINEWVQEYKDGDVEACTRLIEQFRPFLNKQSNKWSQIYQGVHPRDHVVTEAMTIFMDLLNEYTIGGPAYFNVFIERKLPLRLRYTFIKEIKRRTRDLSHSDEQFEVDGLIGFSDNIDELMESMNAKDRMDEVRRVLQSDILSERELDMLTSNIIREESHERIAGRYGISRSRVSRIIKSAIEKLQGEVKYR